MKKEAKKR